MSRKLIDRFLERKLADLPEAPLSEGERLDLVRRHGDFSLAYSTAVQTGLRHFGDARGYIAHSAKMGSLIALGDPVCAPQDRAWLLDAFVDAAKTPVFAEIRRETAQHLAGRGYKVAMMGIDSALDLQTYDFSGKRKETVRYSERWLEKKGYRIAEAEEVADADTMIRDLSERWRASRIVKKREMAFLNRPLPEAGGPMMRRFLLIEPDGRVGCLVYFDPICRDSEVIGYLTAFKRKLPDTTSHAEIGLTKRAADVFKAEGKEILMLGLSPLCDVEPSGFAESRVFRAMLQRLYRSGAVNRKVFNLAGHAAFKRRFHGREEPRYLAWNAGSPFAHFIALMRLSKAF
ncbi:MAG: DUF2156 domain-containing protein [Rhizobiaceae bacterium]|nr:DUF2156 domain-containing protein [Rhizobiaceae bacterium]